MKELVRNGNFVDIGTRDYASEEGGGTIGRVKGRD